MHATAELMVRTLYDYREQDRYELHAYVVMPDHLHLLLTPFPEVPLEKVIQFVKGGFSYRLKSKLNVWKRGHFDKRLASADNYRACVTYIEQNPVKARLTATASAYEFFSAAAMAILDPMPQWMEAPARG